MNTRKRVYGEHSSPPVANLREDEVEVVESRSISTQSRRYTFKLGSSATASAAAILDLKSPLTRVTSTSTTTVADHSFDTRPPPKKRQRRSKWTKKVRTHTTP